MDPQTLLNKVKGSLPDQNIDPYAPSTLLKKVAAPATPSLYSAPIQTSVLKVGNPGIDPFSPDNVLAKVKNKAPISAATTSPTDLYTSGGKSSILSPDVGNEFLDKTTKTDILHTIPFTDQAKKIINDNVKISLNKDLGQNKDIAGRTLMPLDHSRAQDPNYISNVEVGSDTNSASKAHEVFHTLFLRSGIDPTQFNKAWEAAKKKNPDLETYDQRMNDPQNATAYNNGNGESTKTVPYDLATERFSFLGSLWGNDGVSSLPKELQNFYKPYLQDNPPEQPPFDATKTGIAVNTAKGILPAALKVFSDLVTFPLQNKGTTEYIPEDKLPGKETPTAAELKGQNAELSRATTKT